MSERKDDGEHTTWRLVIVCAVLTINLFMAYACGTERRMCLWGETFGHNEVTAECLRALK